MKSTKQFEIKYIWREIELDVKFSVKHPPIQWKYEVKPSLDDIEVFHKGKNIRPIVSEDFSMDLISFLYDNYCNLPIQQS